MTAATDNQARPTWTPQPRPEWVTQLNLLGANQGSPKALVALDQQSLLDAAVEATGLHDFGEDGWREGFVVLVDGLDSSANLTLVGRLLARAEVVRSLIARLQITETYKQHPEIDDEVVSEPVFVTGLGRSGTSILHELIAADPGFRAPLMWEYLYPCPPPQAATRADDPRFVKADIDTKSWLQVTPEFQAMHDYRGDEPAEDTIGSLHSFVSEVWSGPHVVPQYDLFAALYDKAKVFQYHRRLLKLLQFRAPGRWTVKHPGYLASLAPIFAEYPDAKIVVTHRDPLKVMASMVNLTATLQWQRSNTVDYDLLVQRMSVGYTYMINTMMEQRRTGVIPDDQIIDIHYGDLMKDPAATLGRVYTFLGTPFGAEGKRRVREYLAARPTHMHGAHTYSFDELGLDRNAVRETFREYQERYNVPDEV